MTDDDDQPVTPDGAASRSTAPGRSPASSPTAGEGFALVRPKPETGEHPRPDPGIEPPLPARRTARALSRRRLHDALRRRARARAGSGRGLLDTLPAHFDPELAPLDILALPTGWLGLRHNEAQPASQLRELVGRAAELGRLRGTHAGVELALKLNFPDLPLRIEDGGRVLWSTGAALPDPEPPAFVVYCDTPISKDEAATIVRVIEAVKPAHVAFRLRVKGPTRSAAES